MPVFRKLALTFLRSTARGPLVEALAGEAGESDVGGAESPRPGLLSRAFRAVGRGVGLFLSPATKARIQDWIINRYRVSVNLQPDGERLYELLRTELQWLQEEAGGAGLGDYLEFGVYQGNSMIQMHRALAAEGLEQVRLFGFDSFEGLPPSADEEGVWSAGQYRADLDFTRERLTEAGIDWERTVLVPGFFSESLTPEMIAEHGLERASTIMVDCDLYSSACEALSFCAPLIGERALILFDDWNSTAEGEGEQRAFAEFLAENPDLEAIPAGTYTDAAKVFRLRRRESD